MKVWILYDYNDRVEGVYTDAGKEHRETEFYEEALKRREKVNESYTNEILELKALRQPYITEAEMLLDTERDAKERKDGVMLKNVRKQRKILLKQAECLTWDIKCREDKILASQRMTRAELLNNYCIDYYWENHDIIDG